MNNDDNNFQSKLGFIFSVSGLILFILGIVGDFFIQFGGFLLDSIFLISFYLVPIFSLIGLVLCLLNLKKSKLTIIGVVISLLVASIYLFFLLYLLLLV